METIELSFWLKPLGWALFHSLWQGAAIYLGCRLCSLFLQRRTSVRYLLACLSLSLLFLCFAGTFLYLLHLHTSRGEQQVSDTIIGSSTDPQTGLAANRYRLSGTLLISGFDATLPYLVPVYLSILCFLSFRMLKSFYDLRILRDQSRLQNPENELLKKFTTVAERIGIKRTVCLYYSPSVSSPLTLGLFKPLVLLPLAFLSQLSTEQAEAVFYHELFHIKRHDYLINLIQVAMETLLFFNPFSSLLSSMIRAEREYACDERVINAGIGTFSYANALVCLEENRQACFKLTLGMRPGSGQLLDRIKRITGNPAPAAGSVYQFMLLIALLTSILSIGFISRKSHQQTGNTGKQTGYSSADTVNIPAKPATAPAAPAVPPTFPVMPPAAPVTPAVSLTAPARPTPAESPGLPPKKLKRFPAPPRPPKISSVPAAGHEAIRGPLKMEFTDPEGHRNKISMDADTLILPDGEIRITGKLNAAQIRKIQKNALEQAIRSIQAAKRSIPAQHQEFNFQGKLKMDLNMNMPDSMLNTETLAKMSAEIGGSIASLNMQKLKLQQEIAVLQQLKKKFYKEQHPGR